MTSQTVKRATMLVLAIALIVTNTMMVHAQRDPVDSSATTATKPKSDSSVKQTNTNPPTGFAAGIVRTGKASLSQSGKTTAKPGPAKTIAGTDPKKVVSSLSTPSGPTQPQVTQANATTTSTAGSGSQIKQAGLVDSTRGITNDGLDPLTAERKPHRIPPAPDVVMTQPDRGAPPGIIGRNLGLSGQTATEQLVQMKLAKQDLERENEQLRQQLTASQAQLKQNNEHLFTIVREIQSGKKEVMQARSDIEKMRAEVTGLREKIKLAEREHANFLQSMGPLIKQLLEPDEVSGLPPNDTE